MGDGIHKKGALKYGLPKFQQASTKAGLFAVIAGTVATLFGADPALADVIGSSIGPVIGAAIAGAGVHAAVVDDGS